MLHVCYVSGIRRRRGKDVSASALTDSEEQSIDHEELSGWLLHELGYVADQETDICGDTKNKII